MYAGWLPTIARYLLREFLRVLILALACFVGIYLCVDFFERFPSFLRHGASAGLVVEYFLLKIPLILTQMMPAAVLAAALLSLGALARRAELMAMRACGVSLGQIGAPIVTLCLGLSVATAAWNEYVVPVASNRAHYVEHVEIKKRKFRGHFGEWDIWFRGSRSFTNIDRFDAQQSSLVGVTTYLFDDGFRLEKILTAKTARWRDGQWLGEGARAIVFEPDGSVRTTTLGHAALPVEETPAGLKSVERAADDLSFAALARQIRELSRKGIDTTEDRVELWLKTAIPFVGLVMALIAIPLASTHRRGTGLAASVGAALVVGFLYWIVLGLTTSLGRGGVLPPPIAAWSANLLFGAIGAVFFLGAE